MSMLADKGEAVAHGKEADVHAFIGKKAGIELTDALGVLVIH